MTYTKGLVEVADGVLAYLQPDGSWGWSNAGLVVGDGASLLVDTLFDLKLTAEMLDAMAARTDAAPIATVLNTHANGDHCYGNQLVAHAEIIASEAAAAEMHEVPPSMLAALNGAPGELGELFRSFFGAFEFEGIELTLPSRTFRDALTVDVAGRTVELLELGPAHTAGDVIAHLPAEGVVFTGDLVFAHATPIAWAGPLSGWIAACDRITALAPEVVVPGHGPVSTLAEVAAQRDYLALVEREAIVRHDAGMDAWQAARDIALGEFGDWGEFGRIAVNVETVYRHLDSTFAPSPVTELFSRMARLERQS